MSNWHNSCDAIITSALKCLLRFKYRTTATSYIVAAAVGGSNDW